ncbi:MAG: translation initiation factor IF-3 [Chromatiales bacterium]|nr:translation initiation factor IF-3 [Chromatiales bacterium]
MTQNKETRLNDEIDAPEVRLIGADGSQVGVVSIAEALRVAEVAELDLVEIVPTAEPPVCRVMDFGKHQFDESKKRQAQRRRQKQIQVKEVKFRPGTDEGDYQIKLRNLRRFLEAGDRAKITVRFRGREMMHKDLGMKQIERVEHDLEDLATVEQHARLEGRQLVMLLAPKRGKK